MNFFLWPAATYRPTWRKAPGGNSVSALEDAFRGLFPGATEPVAVSSGRAGLAMALQVMGIGREDFVEIPPYASHCLLEAVSRVGTPMPAGTHAGHAAEVIYHQWGYVQRRPVGVTPIIEDACDSLCAPDAQLLPLGGRFEIWSLPKILGCSCGGVVWCRNVGEAEELRRLRESRRGGMRIQWVLRMLGLRYPALAHYWAGRESLCGGLPRFAAAEVARRIESLPNVVAQRRGRLEQLERFRPEWLPQMTDRFPCVLPVEFDTSVWTRLRAMGVTTGPRHFEIVSPSGSRRLVKTLPLPIHQSVTDVAFERILELLETAGEVVRRAAPLHPPKVCGSAKGDDLGS